MPPLDAATAHRENNARDSMGRIFAPAGWGSEIGVLGRNDADHRDFPMRLVKTDQKADTAFMLKARAASVGRGEAGYMGEVKLEQKDLDYIMDKAAIIEDLKFEKFLVDSLPNKTYTDVYHRQNVLGKQRTEEQIGVFKEKISMIQELGIYAITGIWDRRGYELLYNAMTGRFIIPPGFDKLLKGPTDEKGNENTRNIVPGMYSYPRYTDSEKTSKYTIATENSRALASVAIPGFSTTKAFNDIWEGPSSEEGIWGGDLQPHLPVWEKTKLWGSDLPSMTRERPGILSRKEAS